MENDIERELKISSMMDQIRKNHNERFERLANIGKYTKKREKLKAYRKKLLTLIDLLQKKYNISYENTPRLLRTMSENMWYEISLLNKSISDENQKLSMVNHIRTDNSSNDKRKLLVKEK